MTKTTTTSKAPEVRVIPADAGTAVVLYGPDTYTLTDRVATVEVVKVGGESYTVRVGPRGCHGCGCAGKRYGTPRCRHERMSDAFLDEVF